MNAHFITYGDELYAESKRLIQREAIQSGWFKSIEVHSPQTLPSNGAVGLQKVFRCQKGGGFWIWKPLIIQRKLAEIPKGDVLIYADAGCRINAKATIRFQEYMDQLRASDSGSLAFQMGFREEHYTRNDVFDFYSIPLDSTVRQTGQLVAGIQLFQKCAAADAIVQDVMRAVEKCPDLFTDDFNAAFQCPGFIAARHDQSIFSVVRKQHGTSLIPDETYAQDWSTIAHVPILAARRRLGVSTVWQSFKRNARRLFLP